MIGPLLSAFGSRLTDLRHGFLRIRCGIAVVSCFAGFWTKGLTANDDAAHFFETEIRPLLVEQCHRCHGSKKQEAGLRLDSRQAMLKGGENGASIVPGKPTESLLIAAVSHTGDLQMPPSGKLRDTQIDALTHWVELGALWPASTGLPAETQAATQQSHWAFQSIGHPDLPVVREAGWERTPIDRFVSATLEAAGLEPSPPADKRTLIRRVTFDLTGLPPTPEQVEAFLSDSAPDAYPRLIDRLLESPQYGEQWTRHWLDVARYSDTKGYVYAREERFWVHAPAYRDWVVGAFNDDLPYDQFLLLQIAADQAAPDDRKAWAAMGFLTLGRRFLGVTHDIIDDRIDVLTRGTMGLTVACARCHDHKYDPIPTTDYYSLYGVFLNSTEQMDRIAEPTFLNDVSAAFEKELVQRQEQLRDTTFAKRMEAQDRFRQRVTDYLVAQTELSKYPEEGFGQNLATTDVIPMTVRRWEGWLAMEARWVDPVFRPWRQFAALKSDEFVTQAPDLIRQLAEYRPSLNPRVLRALANLPATMRDVAEVYGKLLLEVDGEWQAACMAAKQAGRSEPVTLDLPEAEELRQVLYGTGSPCLIPEEALVSTEWFFDSSSVVELSKLQGEVDRWLIQSAKASPYAVSLVDRQWLRPSRVFRRGNPANRGPEVSRHFVSVVAGEKPPPFQKGSGRLELAQAIIDPNNPLTTRVWVNRVWQHHFGSGLVRTASDFGVRSEQPSHPQLLDWLASRFVADGWSTKNLHRLILLSNTYQQSSDGPSEFAARERATQKDPENRLLWRMTSRRLTFEEFRDGLLSVSGRLDTQMGGRASDLFSENGMAHRRRTLYGLIDRQFLPTTLRVFDFANPDLHIPLRSETTVPQQALFALNHPFVAQQARALVDAAGCDHRHSPSDNFRHLCRLAIQREPSARQMDSALAFLNRDVVDAPAAPPPETLAWQYGYGEFDEASKRLQNFQTLTYFSGSAWQVGTTGPDSERGSIQLTALGGHPGNDLQQCSVRRWTAPLEGRFSLTSAITHEKKEGNGVRCQIIAKQSEVLASVVIHDRREELNVDSITLQKGETVDFVVDSNGDLEQDKYQWTPVIVFRPDPPESTTLPRRRWDAERDFTTPVLQLLNRWEQLAQVLLISNELMFVD